MSLISGVLEEEIKEKLRMYGIVVWVDNVRALSLSEVCNRSTTLKQSCSDADLIVVHSKKIDDAGEANVGIATFETWLQQIKSAWNHLKSIG